MTKALVRLPVGVAPHGVPELMECEGATVAQALVDCVAREPRLKNRILRQDGTPWVGVTLNGQDVTTQIGTTTVKDGDEIRLMPLAGAC